MEGGLYGGGAGRVSDREGAGGSRHRAAEGRLRREVRGERGTADDTLRGDQQPRRAHRRPQRDGGCMEDGGEGWG